MWLSEPKRFAPKRSEEQIFSVGAYKHLASSGAKTISNLKHKCCLAAERRNVYRQVAKKNILAPQERNLSVGTETFRS